MEENQKIILVSPNLIAHSDPNKRKMYDWRLSGQTVVHDLNML